MPFPTAASPSAPSRPALVLLTGWLVVTAFPLAGRITGPAATFGRWRHAALLAATLAALAVTGRAGRGLRGVAAWVARTGSAWLPLAAVPALYSELPLVAAGLAGAGAGFAPMRDATVLRWELTLFGPLLGASPALALARRAPWTPLSELLHLAYLAYYAIIYVPPALLWWDARTGGRRSAPAAPPDRIPDAAIGPRAVLSGAVAPARAFAASVFTVLLAFVLCYTVFALFPVQGPWYTWDTGGWQSGGAFALPHALPLAGPIRGFVQGLLVAGSSRGTAFPSSHVAVSVAQSVVLARVAPRLAAVVAPVTVLLALGAVYGGYHYGVDALVGAVVGTGAGVVGRRVGR